MKYDHDQYKKTEHSTAAMKEPEVTDAGTPRTRSTREHEVREEHHVEDSEHGIMDTMKEHKTATTLMLAGTALAAGFTAYYLSGDKGRERREKAKEWMMEAKDDVAQRLEDAGEVTRDRYHEIVDSVTSNYRDRSADEVELHGFRSKLTSFWDEYADVIDDAKRAGKDIMVMIAEKIRDADSIEDAGKDIRSTLKHSTKEAVRSAAQKTGETVHDTSETAREEWSENYRDEQR